ncbi:MAG TPA: polyphosphate kinase 1 [Longimicrobium sp.]|nr:polyphosphate kinase 1 [Longimicrobium sp.]
MPSTQATPRLDRELSWLAFNHRVLQEAMDPTVPLFDRLGFLAIFSSNLDEFFRVRVALLRAHVRENPDDRASAALLRRLRDAAVRDQRLFGHTLDEVVLPELARRGIRRLADDEVGAAQRDWLGAFFREQVAPKLTPIRLDEGDPPFLRDRVVYLVVEFLPPSEEEKTRYGMVEVPGGSSRFVSLPRGEDGTEFVMYVDDVIRLHLGELFPGERIGASHAYKLSRDAELYVDDDDAPSIAEAVRQSLSRRETGVPSRFLYDQGAPPSMRAYLQKRFALTDDDVVLGGRYHNLNDLHHFPRFGRDDLSAEALPPLPHPVLTTAPSILAAVAERDHLLHFPYQSYEPVLRFLAEAAADEAVEEMWITLYRAAPKSGVVKALVDAAEAGKRVTAIVEVQARFDEAANLEWAAALQAAGVRVVHGLPGLKVHAKLVLVARREDGAARDYVLLSTGNFNERTARIYGDHALLTAHRGMAADVRAVFRRLAGEAELAPLSHLLVAPTSLRSGLEERVEREIEHARAGRPARILVKVNSLEDPEMIDLLYRASREGVEIDLIIRGICCLTPGIPGVGETIRARSLVDRFLEHARIFVFHDNGRDHLYLASADWMTRNLSRRVEACFPVLDEAARRELFAILDLQLADNRKARVLDPGLRNAYVPAGEPAVRAQLETYRYLSAPAERRPATPKPEAKPMSSESAAAAAEPAREERKKGKKDRAKEEEKEAAKRAERSVETMFRTSYRMHTDLSAIADHKSNIMISINGLMISIIVAASKFGASPWLMLPTTVLLVTGVASLAFAVLAAIPRVRTGVPVGDGERTKPNLLFFGSFVSMTPGEYQAGVEELMVDPERLHRSMARDIYGLGTVLERKFKLLRTSYLIFLGGLVTSVLLYLAVYLVTLLSPVQ